jgi:hypothetical protein
MNEFLEQIVEEWAVAKYQKANSINDVSEFIGQLRSAGCDEQANRFWQMFLDELKRIEPKHYSGYSNYVTTIQITYNDNDR